MIYFLVSVPVSQDATVFPGMMRKRGTAAMFCLKTIFC